VEVASFVSQLFFRSLTNFVSDAQMKEICGSFWHSVLKKFECYSSLWSTVYCYIEKYFRVLVRKEVFQYSRHYKILLNIINFKYQ
jgi:hypothetical protein